MGYFTWKPELVSDILWIIVDPPVNASERAFNSINKEKCPFQVMFLTNNMYKATLSSNQDTYQHKIYYHITETRFKQRYADHAKSFKHRAYQRNLELNELWRIKSNNWTPNLVWKILKKHQPLTPNGATCVWTKNV